MAGVHACNTSVPALPCHEPKGMEAILEPHTFYLSSPGFPCGALRFLSNLKNINPQKPSLLWDSNFVSVQRLHI